MFDDDLIRKALEIRLSEQHAALLAVIPQEWKDELIGQGMDPTLFPIKWQNHAWNPPFAVETAITYLQATFHPNDHKRPELGPRSRKAILGHFMIGVRVPEGVGDDITGDLVKVLETAYPYASFLTHEGVDVVIDGFDPRPGFASGGKWYRPVHVNWSVSRRPT